MASTLTLTFTASGVADESFDINGDGLLLTFKSVRLASKQVTIESDIAKQVYQFLQAFLLDYNELGEYTYSYDETTLSLTHFDNDHFDSYIDSSSTITPSINTTTQEVVLSYTVAFSAAAATKNIKVKATLDFNQNVDELILYEVTGTTETEIYNDDTFGLDTLEIEVNRASEFLKVVTTLGTEVQELLFEIPSPLSISNVLVDANNVTIQTNTFLGSNENTYTVTLLGDSASSYNNLPNFSALTVNDYTAWAKDKYGAEVSTTFKVDTEIPTTATNYKLFVSQKNSAFFAEKSFERKNPFSVLSNDDPYPVLNTNFAQTYHDEQLITQQFKSNYPVNKAYLHKCDTTPISLEVKKASDNIKRYVYMDADIVEIEAPYRAIRFSTGNYYNANGTVIGQHTYNDTLPSFLTIGTKIQFYGVSGVITGYNDTTLDDSFAAFTNISFVTIEANPTILRIEVNALDYDVYEFNVPLYSLLNQTFKLRIQGWESASKIPTEIIISDAPSDFVSENIKVISKNEFDLGKWHQCVFFNTGNDTEIDFSKKYNNDGELTLPLKIYRNIEFEFPLRPMTNSEIESLKLDHRVKKIDYSSMFVVETRFAPVPMMYAYSIAKLFDESEYIDIDGIIYTTAPGTKAELDYKGQNAIPKAVLAAVGRSNEFYYETNAIESFYPVVVD